MREDKSTEDIARAVGLSPRTITRLRQAGKIPCVQLGPRTYRFNLDDVVAAMKAAHAPRAGDASAAAAGGAR
jgi:excisionase family DNA binding protein